MPSAIGVAEQREPSNMDQARRPHEFVRGFVGMGRLRQAFEHPREGFVDALVMRKGL